MMVATGLMLLVFVCLLLFDDFQQPPAIGR